jgi:hypothetical protein
LRSVAEELAAGVLLSHMPYPTAANLLEGLTLLPAMRRSDVESRRATFFGGLFGTGLGTEPAVDVEGLFTIHQKKWTLNLHFLVALVAAVAGFLTLLGHTNRQEVGQWVAVHITEHMAAAGQAGTAKLPGHLTLAAAEAAVVMAEIIQVGLAAPVL